MYRWDMKEVEQLGQCYSDYARFMFGTMNEIESALPEDIARRNVNTIRDIVGFNPYFYSFDMHSILFLFQRVHMTQGFYSCIFK
jgi:hypothetical protein